MFVTIPQKYYIPVVSQKHLLIYPLCTDFKVCSLSDLIGPFWLMCFSNHLDLCPSFLILSGNVKYYFAVCIFYGKHLCLFEAFKTLFWTKPDTWPNTKLLLSLCVICWVQWKENLHRKSKRHSFMHLFFIGSQSQFACQTFSILVYALNFTSHKLFFIRIYRNEMGLRFLLDFLCKFQSSSTCYVEYKF